MQVKGHRLAFHLKEAGLMKRRSRESIQGDLPIEPLSDSRLRLWDSSLEHLEYVALPLY